MLDRIGQLKTNLSLPKSPNAHSSQKRNQNDLGKISGKYNKGFDNTTKSTVSQQDKNKSTEKGNIKASLDNSNVGSVKVMSKSDFEKKLNSAGSRSVSLEVGKQKSINSKTSNYVAELTSDGMVKITKNKKQTNESKPIGFKSWLSETAKIPNGEFDCFEGDYEEHVEEFNQIKNEYLDHVETVKFRGESYEVYEGGTLGDHDLYFTSDSDHGYDLLVGFTKKTGCCVTVYSACKNRQTNKRGLALDVYVDYLLPIYGELRSDEVQTTDGINLWKRVYRYAMENNLHFSVYDNIKKIHTPLTDLRDMDSYVGEDYHQYQFSISESNLLKNGE